MEKIRTTNYQELVDYIKTKEMALALACVTFEISVYVDQVKLLINDFAEDFGNVEQRERLIGKIKYSPDVLSAKLFAIQDFMHRASCMLEECQTFKIKEKEETERKNE